MTFAQDIERHLAQYHEVPITVVIGDFGYDSRGVNSSKVHPYLLGHPLRWSDARDALDYTYNTGFGSHDCHPVVVWSETRVVTVHEYDGATWLQSVPRDPTACTPSHF